jgi:hypothetical protein
MGYFSFDDYDLGQRDQQGLVGARFGTLDSFSRIAAIAQTNSWEVYSDFVLDHCDGGSTDDSLPTDIGNRFESFHQRGFATEGRGPKEWLDFHSDPQSTGFCQMTGPPSFLDLISATRRDAAILETLTAIAICVLVRATGLSLEIGRCRNAEPGNRGTLLLLIFRISDLLTLAYLMEHVSGLRRTTRSARSSSIC